MLPPFGQPGQRETRRLVLKDEMKRIWWCVSAIIIFLAVIISLIIIDLAILGPRWVWGILLVFISGVYILAILKPAYRIGGRKYSLSLWGFLFLLIFWGTAGSHLIVKLWPFWILPWPWMHKLITLTVSWVVKIVSVLGIWGFYVELVDPNGPTAPRKAVDHKGPIYPWPFAEKSEPIFTRDLPEIITHRLVSANGKSTGDVDIPKTPEWKQFAQALTSTPPAAGFKETDAKRFHISLTDAKDGEVILVPGFRTIRGRLIALGKAEWKNKDAHNQGVILLPLAIQMLKDIANG